MRLSRGLPGANHRASIKITTSPTSGASRAQRLQSIAACPGAALGHLIASVMNVRPAIPSDCDAIAALHAASWRTTYRNILSDDYLDRDVVDDRHDLWAARFIKFDAGQHHIAVATDGLDQPGHPAPALVGFVCVLLDEEPEHGALLDNLHVAPDRHRSGIGRHLMASAARWVATRQPDWPMHLWVYEQNLKTVAFYRRAGGSAVDQRVIVTPAGNRATVLRFEWRVPGQLAATLDTSLARASSS